MNFKTSLDSAFNIQADLLIDILAIQTLIMDRLITLEAEEKGSDRNEISGAWKEKVIANRKLIAEDLFVKHGPDLSADLGINEQ